MDKRIFLIVFLVMLLLPVASATLSLSNYKEYTPIDGSKYGKIDVWDGNLIFPDEKIKTFTLTKNTDLCIINCEASGTATLLKDGTLFDGVKFETLQKQLTSIESYKWYVSTKTEEYTIDVPDYKEKCPNEIDKMPICWNELIGYHKETKTRDIWEKYNGEELRAGDYKWKLTGKKEQHQSIDWIANTNDVELTEWAIWSAGMNVGLKNYWKLNESSGTTAYDSLGISNGTSEASVVEGSTGIIGTSYDYPNNGMTQMDTSWMNGVTAYSVSIWLYLDSCDASSDGLIARYKNGAGNADMSIYCQETALTFTILGTGDATATATSTMALGGWHHVVGTYNSTTVQVYVDSVAGTPDITSIPSSLQTTTTKLTIGSYYDYSYDMDGRADEIGMWNRSLTESEISDLYNGGTGITYTTDFSPATSLTATPSYPSNALSTNDNTVGIGCNFSTTGTTNITSVNLTVWNASDYVSYGNTIGSLNTQSYNATWTTTALPDGAYHWGCSGFGDDGTNGTSANRTLTVDTTAPSISIISPTGSYVVQNPNENISLNYSIVDIHIESCWYNTTYNATATMLNCSTNSSFLYPPTSPTTLTLYLYANDTLGNQNVANVIITKDTTVPTFILNSLNNVSTLTLPVNATINVTTSDTNLQNCSYKTSDNLTATIYACNIAQDILFLTGGIKTINISANDTFGNQNSSVYTVYIYDFNVTQSGSPTGADGGSASFTLLINSTSFPIGDASANLWYNGANRGYTTKTAIGTKAYYFTSAFAIPDGTGNSTGKGISWYWNYNATQLTTRNTSTQTQTVYNVSITDCALAGGRVILNMSLKDEELNTLVNITSPNVATIEIDLDVSSILNTSLVWNFHKKWESNNSVAVCVPNGLLNSTSYKIDFTVGYDATGKVREFYYMDNGTLDNTDYFNPYTDNTIDLLDLASADSTTFLFTYTDADGLEVDDIIVHTLRKYIGEGLFREVERSKQDTNGETHIHLVEEDVIYYFMISQYGNILYTSNTYNAKCLSTPCAISLSASPTETNWSIIDNEGGKYAITSDQSTRIATLTFDLDKSELVNFSLYEYVGSTATLLNQTSLTSMSGSVGLRVPLAYGNKTFFAVVYNNNTFVKSAWIDLTDRGQDYFGTFGVILGALIVLAIMLMAVTEGAGFIVFTILALIVVTIMKLVDLNWLALISIICAGAIILYKLVSRRSKTG